MRVLASIHLYPPIHNCGSEWMLHNIFKYLISKGHHCRVILQQSEMHKVNCPYEYEGVEVFSATGSLDAYRWADVIITHLDFTQYSIIMAYSVGKPLVHLIHNDIEYNCITKARGRHYIAYNSKWIADTLKYPFPFMVMHPPCDAAYYNVNENPEQNENITLISLNSNKGADIFYGIAEAMPQKKFIGVVGSYDNQIVRTLPNIEIVANTPDILSIYRRTRLLLMPSGYESFGRTATEAMCSGIPVICTPTPGLKENCGDAAIYIGQRLNDTDPGTQQCHRGSIHSWVEAIKSLDNLETYNKYSQLCRERAALLNPDNDLAAFESFIYSAL